MALDGLAVCALAKEFSKKLTGLRIDKIYQPEHDELLITLHGYGENYKLLLSANASIARACFLKEAKSAQNSPPVFCMLLRKHIGGGKIVSVSQPDFERVIIFSVESYNELGDLTVKNLIVEIMGRHSNIILTDEFGRILDSIKRIDFSVSSVRQILPGLNYENPPTQGKKNPLECGVNEFLESFDEAKDGDKADKHILNSFTGISPLISREIVYRALGTTDIFISELDFAKKLDIATSAYSMFRGIKDGKFEPCYLVDKQTEKHIDFCALKVKQYEKLADTVESDSMADLIDDYYRERGKKERNARRNAELLKIVSNNIERCAKKIQIQSAELSDTEKKEQWREAGELITANIYKIKQGDEEAVLENFYIEGMPQVTIKLDKALTPSKNAQRYFKKYNKAKNASIELSKQIELAKRELVYLESVEEAIERANSAEELAAISQELYEQGYIKRNSTDKKKKQSMSTPKEAATSDGFCMFIGRNNKQNDYLTFKIAHGNDLWFHTKNIHGSHVVLRFDNERDFSETAIIEAASAAAYNSKARDSQNVPVDYTQIRYVKKPSASPPGFVIYTSNKTVYVTPKEV